MNNKVSKEGTDLHKAAGNQGLQTFLPLPSGKSETYSQSGLRAVDVLCGPFFPEMRKSLQGGLYTLFKEFSEDFQ